MRACGDDALAAPKTRGDKRLVVLHGLDGDGTGWARAGVPETVQITARVPSRVMADS
jgi:hypothetical protein